MAVKALHLVRNNFVSDSRILKETQSLLESGIVDEVTIVALGDSRLPEHESLDRGRSVWRVPLVTRERLPKDLVSQSIKYGEWARRIVKRYAGENWNVIHCHDLAPLPIAAALVKRTGARLIYDAHELETEVFGLSGVRQFLSRHVEQHFVRSVDAAITVSPSIRAWYRDTYPGLSVSLVRNIPHKITETQPPYPWRKELGVPDGALLFIYVGNFASGRGIPLLLDVFTRPDCRHHILFMGSGALEPQIQQAAKQCLRIHHHAPVPMAEVVRRVAGADIGLSLLEDTCLNHRYALPNKFFECLQAGVPVLVSDLLDQRNIVTQSGAGWVASHSVGGLAAVVNGIDQVEYQRKSEAANKLATTIDWNSEAQQLIDVYRRVMSSDATRRQSSSR